MTGGIFGAFLNSTRLGTEITLNTAVAGANDTVVGTANSHYIFFTVSSDYHMYSVTGIEWLNGTVVAGNVLTRIEVTNADPPTANNVGLVCWSAIIAQSGAAAVQRNNRIHGSRQLFSDGTVYAASLVSDSATARFGTTTVASANMLKARALAADQPTGDSTAFAADTERIYLKIYGRPVI